MTDKADFMTRAVRAGLETDEVTGAVVPPIHLSATYAFRGYGEKRAYDYSRSGNPTRDLLGDARSKCIEIARLPDRVLRGGDADLHAVSNARAQNCKACGIEAAPPTSGQSSSQRRPGSGA